MRQVLLTAVEEVTGNSFKPPIAPSLFYKLRLSEKMNSVIDDIKDLAYLQQVMNNVQHEIVIYMATYPIVRDFYTNPVIHTR